MKKILLRLAFSIIIYQSSISNCAAQWVTIPDANFVTYITQYYPQCMNGNLMDTTCAAVVNAGTVDCQSRSISDLTGISYFDNLDNLFCPNNLLTNLPALPGALRELNCGGNQITALPALPPGLVELNCGTNQIGSLPALPNSLTGLYCSHNFLGSLPALPNSLAYLGCHWNYLNSLPSIPASVVELWCNNNQLSSLPVLPNGLRELDCHLNDITSLPTLPDSLTYLDCSNNLLTSLPVLKNKLALLYCYYNTLSSLPPLPNRLSGLSCFNNALSSLPPLPNTLLGLYCNNNQLTSLPAFPNGLTHLDCSNNQLSSLPAFPNSVVDFFCNDNQLTSLPPLPDSLNNCNVYNNPITCLPQLKRIRYLYFHNTLVTCIPNHGKVTDSSPPLNTLPFCDLFNPDGCEVFWNISGEIYYDGNSNCVREGIDTALHNVKLKLWSGNTLLTETFTMSDGYYSFDTDSFSTYTVTVDTADIPFLISCPVNGVQVAAVTALDSFHYNKDFALECKTGFDLAAWSIRRGWSFRPANFTTVSISVGDISNFYGVHCAAGASGAVTVTITGSATYISPANGALTPNVSGNVLTYNIADFGAVNFNSDFNIIVQTDTNAVEGSQVCFNVSVTPTTGDNNPADNSLTHCFEVQNSFDPNNKEVYPAADIDTAQEWLTYTVNFQNTGTAEAQHIYLTDTLDADLDVSSFQLLVYSHQPMVQIKENAVRFNFPNINLPDSNTNEPLSHGYVQYKIKLKDNLPIGTQINNTAFIYFDFNTPVVTNTTTNTITNITGVSQIRNPQSEIQISPNPASGMVTISVDEGMIGSIAIVTDITGRKVAAVQLQTPNSKLETPNFSNGVYFVSVANASRSVTRKLVVNR